MPLADGGQATTSRARAAFDLSFANNAPPQPRARRVIGQVAQISGTNAVVELEVFKSTGEHATVGKFMGLTTGKTAIIAFITKIGEQPINVDETLDYGASPEAPLQPAAAQPPILQSPATAPVSPRGEALRASLLKKPLGGSLPQTPGYPSKYR